MEIQKMRPEIRNSVACESIRPEVLAILESF